MKSAVFSLILATRARPRTGVLVALGALLLVSLPAAAIPIEFSFTGTVTEKSIVRRTALGNDYRLVPTDRLGTIAVGSSFSGSYLFELDQPDLNPTDTYGSQQFEPGSIGEYVFTRGTLTVGGYTHTLLPPAPGGLYRHPINILNGVSGIYAYVLSTQTLGPSIEGYMARSFGFQLDYAQGSDALSEIPPSGASSSNTRPFSFSLVGGRDGILDDVRVGGAFSSFTSARVATVPLPGTLALVLAALAGLVRGTRRSR